MLQVEYLGHVIDEYGLHPTKEKVKAIKEALNHTMLMSSDHFWVLSITMESSCLTSPQN